MDRVQRTELLRRLALPRLVYLLGFAVIVGGGVLGGRYALSDMLILRVLVGLFWVGIPAFVHTVLVWRAYPDTMTARSARIASTMTAIVLFRGMLFLPVGTMPAPDAFTLAFVGGLWGMMMYTPSHLREIAEEFAQRRRDLGLPQQFNGG